MTYLGERVETHCLRFLGHIGLPKPRRGTRIRSLTPPEGMGLNSVSTHKGFTNGGSRVKKKTAASQVRKESDRLATATRVALSLDLPLNLSILDLTRLYYNLKRI